MLVPSTARRKVAASVTLLLSLLLSSCCFGAVHSLVSVAASKNGRRMSACSSSSTSTTEIFIPAALQETGEDSNENPHYYPTRFHSIYMTPELMSPEQAAQVLELARAYAAETGCWDAPDTTRHVNFATCDFAIADAPALESYLIDKLNFYDSVLHKLRQWYQLDDSTELEWLDLFCAHYQAPTGNSNSTTTTTMDRLEPHRDGSLLSFTITLTPPDVYEGGGTTFDCFPAANSSALRPPYAGGAVVHVGKVLHGAAPVRSGHRTVLVGFVDVAAAAAAPLVRAARDWGRLDVAANRWKRYRTTTNKSNNKKKNTTTVVYSATERWTMGHSCLPHRVPCPPWPSVLRRAQPGWQRRARLRTEDRLLRSLEL